MSKRRVAVGASLLGLVAAGALSFGQGSATADIAPQAKDVVGVGSDVIQNSVDFLSDGSPLGDPGYNSAGNLYRIFDFDASPDANGRAAFQDPSLASGGLTGTSTTSTDGGTSVTTGTGVPLRGSAVLAAGESPQERPNGGSAGVTALDIDSGDSIDFVRSPNPPASGDQSKAGGTDGASGNLGSYIDTVQFADDAQYIATASTTNVPAGLTAETLAAIYCKNFTPTPGDAYDTAGLAGGSVAPIATWGQIPGYSGSNGSKVIVPLRPQDGAGVLKPFQTALNAFASGGSCSWSGNVTPVQQNDPTTITGSSDPADTIVVFPLSRYKLLADAYYPDTTTNGWVGASATPATGPATAAAKRLATGGFPANASGKSTVPLSASGIKLQIPSGKPGDTTGNQLGAGTFTEATAGSYYADLKFYILLRHSDVTSGVSDATTGASTNPWQPGSTLNWAETLFYNPAYAGSSDTTHTPPFFASAAGQQLLTNLGLTPTYQVWVGNSSGQGDAQY